MGICNSILSNYISHNQIKYIKKGQAQTDLPIYNIFIHFIIHKFLSIHLWTSFSLTLTKRAIVFTSIPSSAIERTVSFFALSSPFSMPRFSPFSQLFTVSGCHISETDFVMFYFHFDFLTILLTWKTPSTALFLHNHQSLP